jgi:hypothetical protein
MVFFNKSPSNQVPVKATLQMDVTQSKLFIRSSNLTNCCTTIISIGVWGVTSHSSALWERTRSHCAIHVPKFLPQKIIMTHDPKDKLEQHTHPPTSLPNGFHLVYDTHTIHAYMHCSPPSCCRHTYFQTHSHVHTCMPSPQ